MKPGVRRLIEDLRGARVLVIHPRDAESEALIDQLKRIGCNVRGVWPPPATIPHDIDTVFQIVDSSEDMAFPASSSEHPLTLVAIVDYENPTILKRLLDSNAHGVVNKPIRSFGILSSLVLARCTCCAGSTSLYLTATGGKVCCLDPATGKISGPSM